MGTSPCGWIWVRFNSEVECDEEENEPQSRDTLSDGTRIDSGSTAPRPLTRTALINRYLLTTVGRYRDQQHHHRCSGCHT